MWVEMGQSEREEREEQGKHESLETNGQGSKSESKKGERNYLWRFKAGTHKLDTPIRSSDITPQTHVSLWLTYVGVIQHLHDPHLPEELQEKKPHGLLCQMSCSMKRAQLLWVAFICYTSKGKDDYQSIVPVCAFQSCKVLSVAPRSIFKVGANIHFLRMSMWVKLLEGKHQHGELWQERFQQCQYKSKIWDDRSFQSQTDDAAQRDCFSIIAYWFLFSLRLKQSLIMGTKTGYKSSIFSIYHSISIMHQQLFCHVLCVYAAACSGPHVCG